MPKNHSSPVIAALALGGSALAASCSLVYDYGRYTQGSTTSGSGGTGGGTATSSTAAGTGGTATSTGGTATGTGGTAGGGGAGEGGLGKTQWARQFGGSKQDLGGRPGIDVNEKDEVFIAGVFEESILLGTTPLTSVNNGMFLARLDTATGDVLWARRLAHTTQFDIASLAATADGVVVAGNFDVSATLDGSDTAEPAKGARDIFVVKYDSDGNKVWGYTFGGTAEENVRGAAVDPAGNVYLTGQLQGDLSFGGPCAMTATNTVGGDGFLVQLGASGSCNWASKFHEAGPSSSGPFGQDLSTLAGGVILAGCFTATTTVGDKKLQGVGLANGSFVARFKTDGEVVFALPLPTIGFDPHVASNPETGGAFYGATSFPNGVKKMTVGELDGDGTLKWTKTFASTGDIRVKAITRAPSGAIFVGGVIEGTSSAFGGEIVSQGGRDILLVKLDAKGEPLDAKAFGDMEYQSIHSIRVNATGNVYFCGDFGGKADLGGGPPLSAAGLFDIAVARLFP